MSILENDKLKASISEHGAELTSVLNKSTEKECLWQADPKMWARHAPVLFPFVGKVYGGKYRYHGEKWNMGQHGFARDMDFTTVCSDTSTATYELTDSPETRAKYPFAFTLKITYKLVDNTLRILWTVENPGDTSMYFSIGGHPAFPAKPGYFVTFDGQKELQYYLLDPESGCVDAEHPRALNLPDGYLEMTPELFDHDALIFDNAQIARATLCYADKSPFVTISCEKFPSFGLWSPTGAGVPFVCLEPWMGRADNVGFEGELSERYEEQILPPGGRFTAEYSLSFE